MSKFGTQSKMGKSTIESNIELDMINCDEYDVMFKFFTDKPDTSAFYSEKQLYLLFLGNFCQNTL